MNINNGKTGNVNIPGALHSTGGDGDGQVGGVVAYAGDVYDETLGKNQKEINQTLLDGSADSNVIAVALNDLNEKVEEQEKVTSSGLNDLSDKTDNLTKDIKDLEKVTSSSLNDLDEKVEEQEKVISSSLNDLNEKVNDLKDNELVVSSSLVDLNDKVDDLNDKINDSELVTASALADLDEKTDNNEKAVSAALNDLNDKIDNSTQPASNVSFDDNVTQLGTQESPINNVQDAINQLATGIRGFTGKLIVRLLYANNSPITNKEVSITVNWRGESYDISSMYSPNTQGFKTDSNGYVIDAANHEFLILPLGAIYTIHFHDISINYITPEDKTGIIDANSKTINCVYDNVSDNEMVYAFVQMPNVSPSVATTNNKILYVYYYDNNDVSYLQYKCLLRDNGTIKQILNSDDTQATFNGNNLISNNPVLIPIPIGNKYTCALQEWDETIPSTQQEYVKSTNQTFIASKIKRSIIFNYNNIQLGIFLIVEDSTKSIGYRECIVTNQDTENNRITFKDGESTYYAYLNNSSLYKELVNSNTPVLWEENIIGYGIRTSILISTNNNDVNTNDIYPNCCFFVPTDIQFQSGRMLSNDINITLDI